jgi:hypothetical protein
MTLDHWIVFIIAAFAGGMAALALTEGERP